MIQSSGGRRTRRPPLDNLDIAIDPFVGRDLEQLACRVLEKFES